MFEFIALLLGITIPVGAFVALLRRGKTQLDCAVAYRQVASRLGLMVDTRGVSLQGHLGDRRLWVGEVMVGHGPDRRMAIWGVLDMERPLGLGLQIRRRGLSERVFQRGRAPGVELGDEALDKRVEVLGDEPTRVRALVGDRDVKSALTELMSRWSDVVVTDYSVRVHLPRPETTEFGLQSLVDSMVTLSGALERARESVSVPARLEPVVEDFRALSVELGLEIEAWLPAVVGERDGRRLLVSVSRAEGGYEADLRLYFRDHRALGLRLRPQIEPDGYWSVGQDIQVEDSDFDAAFVIKGWDPGKIRALLGPELRSAVLALAELGSVSLDDQRMHVRNLPLAGKPLGLAIERATQVANHLDW